MEAGSCESSVPFRHNYLRTLGKSGHNIEVRLAGVLQAAMLFITSRCILALAAVPGTYQAPPARWQLPTTRRAVPQVSSAVLPVVSWPLARCWCLQLRACNSEATSPFSSAMSMRAWSRPKSTNDSKELLVHNACGRHGTSAVPWPIARSTSLTG